MIKTKKGFTLIEILITIMIIGILATIVTFSVRQAQQSARDGKRKSDLETIAAGLEIYRAECNRYPASISFGGSLSGNNSLSTCASSNVYISSIPNDPSSPGRSYSYTSNASGSTYTMCAALEQGGSTVSGCGTCGTTCNYRISRP